MFLVAVDANSKWPEAYVMSSTTVPKTLDKFAYGLPDQIVSDNGPQFVASELLTL